MTSLNYSKKIQAIHDKYGLNAMREIWIEELLELAQVLQQSKRDKLDLLMEDAIVDEIADVSFCIDQMTQIFGKEKVENQKQFKIDRTIKRLL